MQLVQFEHSSGRRHVGCVDGDSVVTVNTTTSVRNLALAASAAGHTLAAEIDRRGLAAQRYSLATLLEDRRVLPPLDHDDANHCLVTGTGLTHTGSATTRDGMHTSGASEAAGTPLSDSMRMFRRGLDDGRPARNQVGAQPEWFYKGNGHILARPGAPLPAPRFGQDLGEEPEIAGLYVIGHDRLPYRIGYALANEASDHVIERRNYLDLAHSKLRHCAVGPLLLNATLPHSVEGLSRIWRDGEVLWERSFFSGEAHMCHSLDNLEYHHFKYAQFLTPGDVHIHFFGTATLSFADAVQTQPGDTFEIASSEFGPPLRNTITHADEPLPPGAVQGI